MPIAQQLVTSHQVNVHDAKAIRDLVQQHKVDPYALRRLHYALFVQGHSDDFVWQKVPARFRPSLEPVIELHTLAERERRESTRDGAIKFLYHTRGGAPVEAVAMKAKTGRTTACVSSQSGCAAACTFCATGGMGLRSQLTVAEILDQVVGVRQHLAARQMRLRNVVFMGMGEPLHNETSVYGALEALQSEELFRFSPNRVMVSSIGVPGAMERFAKRFPRTGFALSLHSVQQSIREQLIPLAKSVSLANIRQWLELLLSSGRSVMIEYLMLRGINDSHRDASDLAAFLAGLRVHINLIPYNQVVRGNFHSSPQAQRDAFARVLREAGFLTTIRYSQGDDIHAACGQLAAHGQSSA